MTIDLGTLVMTKKIITNYFYNELVQGRNMHPDVARTLEQGVLIAIDAIEAELKKHGIDSQAVSEVNPSTTNKERNNTDEK